MQGFNTEYKKILNIFTTKKKSLQTYKTCYCFVVRDDDDGKTK